MKNKICSMCKLTIDLEKEFCEFKHYSKQDVILSKAWYHVECFRNKLLNSMATNQVQMKALDVLNKIGMRVS